MGVLEGEDTVTFPPHTVSSYTENKGRLCHTHGSEEMGEGVVLDMVMLK